MGSFLCIVDSRIPYPEFGVYVPNKKGFYHCQPRAYQGNILCSQSNAFSHVVADRFSLFIMQLAGPIIEIIGNVECVKWF